MARRSFTPEFRREAVRLARKPGISRRQAAKQLGIHPNVLAYWCKQVDEGNWSEQAGSDLKTEQAKELERLRRENAELKMERDILKKAAAYFARESK
jgi:transposase